MRKFLISGGELLKNASKKSRVKDQFVAYCYDPGVILSCLIKSKKTDSEYEIHLDYYKNEVVFSSRLRNWENIRNISDSFWVELIDISSRYNVQFIPDGGPIYDKEKTPEFNSNYKSIVFNLMSVYITAMLESENDRQNIGFGQLEVAWTPKKSTDEIVKELDTLFKVFYRFNYLLWKSGDLRRQNQVNKRKKAKHLPPQK